MSRAEPVSLAGAEAAPLEEVELGAVAEEVEEVRAPGAKELLRVLPSAACRY
jgi:hypothetical protein